MIDRVRESVVRLGGVTSRLELARATIAEVRALTGFERVAIHRRRGEVLEPVAWEPASAPPAQPLSLGDGESIRFEAERSEGAALVIALPHGEVVACEHAGPLALSSSTRSAAQLVAEIYAGRLAAHDRLEDELRASSLAKDEFLATVSHELRTPLNAMLGWLRLIEAGQVARDRRDQALATITRNAEALAHLVEELLDVSRIITGKMALAPRPVAPAEVLEAALATAQPGAAAKGIRLAASLEADAGPVLADPARLQQIVWNLLANALKFTPEGGEIEVVLRRAGEQVEIVVADSGIGIAPQLLPYVFDRFRQGEHAGARAHGLGLGLSIVRRLVELHGGEVAAESAGSGRGSRFTVRLPLAARGPAPARPSAPVFEPAAQLRGLRVLAVDDEHDANELVRAVLATCGAHVTTAASATEALRVLPALRPQVLVSDIGMPGVDGYELIQAVRALPEAELARVPAVAVTAFARGHDRSRAFLAGFDGHLAKPIDPGELVAALVTLTGRRAGAQARVDGAPAAGRVLAGARILIVEDDLDSGEMLCALLHDAGAITEHATTAADGRERLHRFRPDVLVSDLTLPDKDGLAFIRELRAVGADEGGWIPAIAVSGHADPTTAQAALLAGFQLHLPKPVDTRDLVARLARLVGRTIRRN